MAKRKLSQVEHYYITNHTHLTLDEVYAMLPEEVNKTDVRVLYETTKNRSVDTQPIKDPEAFIVGNVLSKRSGAVIMNESAAELADERAKEMRAKQKQINPSARQHIHIIDPSKGIK